ncbi:MAG: amidohydrolase family protein [Candidatus Heimdallarchaeaceae archaeon]
MTDDKIIEAEYLITCDNLNRIIHDGAVYVVNDKICAVGKKQEIHKNYSAKTILDGENKIVLPGLINTHSHSVQTLLRGKADDLALLDWLRQIILPGESTFEPEEVYTSSLLGFAEMIRTGTTTTNDMLTTHDSEEGIRAAIKSGIRTRIGKMLMDINNQFPDNMINDTEEIIETVYDHINKYHRSYNCRIRYSLNARFLLSCSPQLMKEIAQIHNEIPDILIHTHASESQAECKAVERMYNKSYIRALKELGVLGPRTILAHGIWLDDEEFEIIKKTNTKIAHNPSSNAKLASGICDVTKYHQQGIIVGLATDGAPSNNNLDMFREMRLATFLQKLKHLNEKALPAVKVLRMATIEGAKAINMEKEIGSLEVGKKADIIQVNINDVNAYPLYDPISHLVYSASGKDVITTIIDGKIVYQNGEFTTFSKKELFKNVQNYVFKHES